ncbi:MAG: 16S rRNA (cytosine(1402)-N(4))-methyltransferase RsmH [Alphaproteobacteria bacterium]
MNEKHIPVLLKPVIRCLTPEKGGVFVDGTFGAGGYTQAILKSSPDTRVIAFDRDESVLSIAQSFQTEFGDRFTFIQERFGEVAQYITTPVDGFVLDIGVSSMQIDTPERGFSFRFDGPLDMRMGSSGLSAADIVNHWPEEKLADILYLYGEEKASRKIAHAISAARPIKTTLELAGVIHSVMPRPKDGSDSAMRTFQALRIAVNDELGELERALSASPQILKAGGRLVVVSFHSLEDRIVKDFLKKNTAQTLHKNKYALKTEAAEGLFILPDKKPIVADEEELKQNPRAHSAKLRWAIRGTK